MLNNASLPPLTLNSLTSSTAPVESPQQSDGLFSQMLSDAMGQVAGQQAQTERLVEDHLLGHSVTNVEVLTKIKQADLTLKAMVQIRNKVVEAYNELRQIQV